MIVIIDVAKKEATVAVGATMFVVASSIFLGQANAAVAKDLAELKPNELEITAPMVAVLQIIGDGVFWGAI